MRDPLCMAEHQQPPLGECTCDAYARGREDVLSEAVQRVEALLMDPPDGRAPRWGIADVIAAIKGDSDE